MTGCVKEDVPISVLLDSFQRDGLNIPVEGEGLKSKLLYTAQKSIPDCFLQERGCSQNLEFFSRSLHQLSKLSLSCRVVPETVSWVSTLKDMSCKSEWDIRLHALEHPSHFCYLEGLPPVLLCPGWPRAATHPLHCLSSPTLSFF